MFEVKLDFKGTQKVPLNLLDIEDKLKKILLYKFPNVYQKQNIDKFDNRITFACPYCGDSDKNYRKHRGNLFTKNFLFKCFNCGIVRNINTLINDFSSDKVNYNLDEFIVPQKIFNFDFGIKEFAIQKNDMKTFFKLENNNENEYLNNYLEYRKIKQKNKFLYDKKRELLYILNIDRNDLVFSYSCRIMKNTNKYGSRFLNYKMSKMYENLNIKNDIPDDYDRLSLIYNLFNIDFNNNITVFEGQIDSLFYPNSIASLGVQNNLPFDIENLQYWLDNDDPGKNRSLELIKNGKKVFLWKKYLNDNNIKNHIKDLNELIMKYDGSNINFDFSNYFSNSPYDAYYI